MRAMRDGIRRRMNSMEVLLVDEISMCKEVGMQEIVRQ